LRRRADDGLGNSRRNKHPGVRAAETRADLLIDGQLVGETDHRPPASVGCVVGSDMEGYHRLRGGALSTRRSQGPDLPRFSDGGASKGVRYAQRGMLDGRIQNHLTATTRVTRQIAAEALAVEGVRLATEALGTAVVLGKVAVVATDLVVMVELVMGQVVTVETTSVAVMVVAAVVMDVAMMILVETIDEIILGTAGAVRGLVIAGIVEIHKIIVKEDRGPGMETAPGH